MTQDGRHASRPLTPAQLVAARGLLGWSRDRLAAASDTTANFIFRYEVKARIAPLYWRPPEFDGLAAVRVAFETAGVEFVEQNGGGAGVRLRKDGLVMGERQQTVGQLEGSGDR